jgi:hypothetical protein
LLQALQALQSRTRVSIALRVARLQGGGHLWLPELWHLMQRWPVESRWMAGARRPAVAGQEVLVPQRFVPALPPLFLLLLTGSRCVYI